MAAAAAGEEVKVIGTWTSPFVFRVLVALELKKVAYDYLPEATGLSVKSDMLLRSNPVHKKIPVLIHRGGRPICESLVILQYIDEAWPAAGAALLPAADDPRARAAARFWAAFVDDKLFPPLIGILKAATEEAKAEAAAEVGAALDLLERAFGEEFGGGGGGGFFNGDSIGYVDITLGSWLTWFDMVERIEGLRLIDGAGGGGRTPLLASWARRFRDDEVVRSMMTDTDEMVIYAKLRQAVWKSSGAAAAAAALAELRALYPGK